GRRRDPAREPLPRAHLPGVRPPAADALEAAGRAVEALRLAGQRAGAQERDRAGRDPLAGEGPEARSRDERHPAGAGRAAARRRAARAPGADGAGAARSRAGEHARGPAARELASVGAERRREPARREEHDVRRPDAEVPHRTPALRTRLTARLRGSLLAPRGRVLLYVRADAYQN